MININENNQKNQIKIHEVDVTYDKLTGRAGMAFFSKFIESTSILLTLSNVFAKLKSNKKGADLQDIFKQLICFFTDGTSRHLSYFDHLKCDEGYAAAIETAICNMCSSHQIKRFFAKFTFIKNYLFRSILQKMFISTLKKENPKEIFIFVDTMVLDNDCSKKREGVKPTYKKVKGFQPLQFIWNNLVIDCVFRSGNKHCNNGDTVKKAIAHIVYQIRNEYDQNAKLIFLFDSGFFDDSNFKFMEDIGVYYICAAKFFKFVKKEVSRLSENDFSIYKKGLKAWKYSEFEYKCDKWKNPRRAIYTVLMNEENGQCILGFNENSRVIVTNIEKTSEEILNIDGCEELIELNHSRGNFEKTHKNIKEFGFEQMPFKRFESNAAFYYMMLISYNLFELFKRNCLLEINDIQANSYPQTVRRIFIDIAGKIVKTGRKIILKFSKAVLERLLLKNIWEYCQKPLLL